MTSCADNCFLDIGQRLHQINRNILMGRYTFAVLRDYTKTITANKRHGSACTAGEGRRN